MNVFVYGTLLQGLSRYWVLEQGHAHFLGLGRLAGDLYDLGAFPGLCLNPTAGAPRWVYGEVYAVDDNLLAELDDIEDYLPDDELGSMYLRRQQAVTSLHGDPDWQAHTYVYNQSLAGLASVPQGEYRRYLLEQEIDWQWYIAYGSNLNGARLRERVGPPKEVTTGVLEGWRLVFNKQGQQGNVFANLVPGTAEDACPFAAYLLDPEQFQTLDAFEGAPNHYIRLGMPFVETAGDAMLGQIYIAQPEWTGPEDRPSMDYLAHLQRGYRQHGFDMTRAHRFIQSSS